MSKAKRKSKKQQVGNEKPKTLPNRIKIYADFFRNLPETQRPLVQAEGDEQWRKLPYRPTELWLNNAGGSVRGAMRLGAFKEYQNLLSVAFDKGGEKLWIELIKTLRKRANLPPTWDFLKTFADDCKLVAEALESEEINLPVYIAMDIANRTVTVGSKTTNITSEKVWDFLKDLRSAKRDDRIVPHLDGAVDNKNNVDQLRRKIGKDELHKLVIFANDGYKLNPATKIINDAQIGIRKTKY